MANETQGTKNNGSITLPDVPKEVAVSALAVSGPVKDRGLMTDDDAVVTAQAIMAHKPTLQASEIKAMHVKALQKALNRQYAQAFDAMRSIRRK